MRFSEKGTSFGPQLFKEVTQMEMLTMTSFFFIITLRSSIKESL